RMTSQHQPGMSIAVALTEAAQLLRASGHSDARRDAAALLMHTLNCARAFLITHSDDALAPDALAQFRLSVERRAQGEPLRYITASRLGCNSSSQIVSPRSIRPRQTSI